MQQLPGKTVAESRTEQVQIIMFEQINGFNRLFGGKLVEWIDVVAAVVARRHSNRNVTTVSIDNLHFKAAAHINSTVVLVGTMTHVGRTSMEVRVDTFVEELDGSKKMVNRAYLTMVALDDEDRPTPVPRLILTTDEERLEWEAAERRAKLHKQRRIEQF